MKFIEKTIQNTEYQEIIIKPCEIFLREDVLTLLTKDYTQDKEDNEIRKVLKLYRFYSNIELPQQKSRDTEYSVDNIKYNYLNSIIIDSIMTHWFWVID